mgnify:CR=1 FL=1
MAILWIVNIKMVLYFEYIYTPSAIELADLNNIKLIDRYELEKFIRK